MNSAEVTERYFASIRARDIEALIALYADNATFTLPNGREFSGIAAIREMHLGVFATAAPIPNPLTTVIGQNCAAVEIQARLPDGTTRHTANFYHLDNTGRIQRLSVYMRGG